MSEYDKIDPRLTAGGMLTQTWRFGHHCHTWTEAVTFATAQARKSGRKSTVTRTVMSDGSTRWAVHYYARPVAVNAA